MPLQYLVTSQCALNLTVHDMFVTVLECISQVCNQCVLCACVSWDGDHCLESCVSCDHTTLADKGDNIITWLVLTYHDVWMNDHLDKTSN